MKTGLISLVRNTFQKPYVLQALVARRWLTCLLYGSFVFLFLFIFRPFGLGGVTESIFAISFGYGLTTFATMALLNIALFSLFPAWFPEEGWTVGREFLWVMLNIFLVGIANLIFGGFIHQFYFSFRGLFLIETYTLAVGVFPVTLSILIKEARLKKKYEQGSGQINQALHTESAPVISQTPDIPGASSICIPSENSNEDLYLAPGELLYIRSSDNYVEVVYRQQKTTARKVIRNSLKNVSEALAPYPRLFRCHKSYLVNLDLVSHVSGNAQGYKLHLPGLDILIPVSRQLNDEIKNRLTASPA